MIPAGTFSPNDYVDLRLINRDLTARGITLGGRAADAGQGTPDERSHSMTLTQLARIVLKQWFVVVIAMLCLGGLGFGLSKAVTPQYEATTNLFFSLRFGSSAGDLAQGSTYTQNQMQSFGLLATSDTVLQPVIDKLGLSTTPHDLSKVVTVETPRNTVVMKVTVTNPNGAQAARIANAIGTEIAAQVESLGPKTANGATLVTVTTIEKATPPRFASMPNTRRNTALGLVAGFVLGALIVLAVHAFDTKVRNSTILSEITQVPFLGAIRRGRESGGHELVVLQDPISQDAEDFRKLRASLQYVGIGRHPLVLMVTSSMPAEGKSTVACNLAAALAEGGRRTLLLDVDLRKPRVAEFTRTESSVGLTDLLIGEAELDEVVQPVGDTRLEVVPAGHIPPNPGELLASEAMLHFLAQVKDRYDYIIIDTPPVLAVADPVGLASLVDGAILVAHAQRVTKSQVSRALEALSAAGTTPLGTVLNAVKSSRRAREYSYRTDGRVARKSTRSDRVSEHAR